MGSPPPTFSLPPCTITPVPRRRTEKRARHDSSSSSSSCSPPLSSFSSFQRRRSLLPLSPPPSNLALIVASAGSRAGGGGAKNSPVLLLLLPRARKELCCFEGGRGASEQRRERLRSTSSSSTPISLSRKNERKACRSDPLSPVFSLLQLAGGAETVSLETIRDAHEQLESGEGRSNRIKASDSWGKSKNEKKTNLSYSFGVLSSSSSSSGAAAAPLNPTCLLTGGGVGRPSLASTASSAASR